MSFFLLTVNVGIWGQFTKYFSRRVIAVVQENIARMKESMGTDSNGSYRLAAIAGTTTRVPYHSCLWILLDCRLLISHCNDVIMSAMASVIASLTIVYSTGYLDADQRKHQSSASLTFVRGIHRWPMSSPHKGPVTRKMFPFDDVIILNPLLLNLQWTAWLG